MSARPVFFTDPMIVSRSIGLSVLRSTISALQPFSAARTAAFSATGTIAPQATMVRSVPSPDDPGLAERHFVSLFGDLLTAGPVET